jgi:hypothetical protein
LIIFPVGAHVRKIITAAAGFVFVTVMLAGLVVERSKQSR